MTAGSAILGSGDWPHTTAPCKVVGAETLASEVALAQNPWRERLYALRTAPMPVWIFADAALPAAAVWTGSRMMLRELLSAVPADEAIVVHGAPGPSWLQLAVAALFAGRPLCIAANATTRIAACRVPQESILLVDEAGAETALPFAAVLDEAATDEIESVELSSSDWHLPSHAIAALRSLLRRAHVLCM